MLKKIAYLCLLLPAFAIAQTIIPEEIAVPDGNTQVLSLHAKGEQIYQCTSQQSKYSWQWQAPKAQLFDSKGHLVGSHAVGPEWTYQDGSRVMGKMIKKVELAPDTTVAWLLLEATQHHGNGVFANISFIQRVKTRGGLPPVTGCDGNHLGLEKSVNYSSDYIFYTEQQHHAE
ncbi:MAG: DUF3455 domain-containing protein [Methylococcales bacterium]|nr:DUF3455 domain-containing protein [Methylococcales bacterium]